MFDAFKKNIHTSSHENWPQLDHNCHWYPLMKPWPKLGGRRRYLTDVNNRMMDCELSRELEAQGGREGGASSNCRLPTRPQRRPKEAPAWSPTGFDQWYQCFRSFPVCVFGLGFTSVRVTESHTLRPGPIPTTNAGSAARLVVAHLEDAPVLYPREGRTLLCLHIFAGHICLVTDIYSENMETYMQNYANSYDNNIQ